jgi:hypothetical protein
VTILEEALSLVRGDRNEAYGRAIDDYTRSGIISGVILHEWAKEAAKSDVPIPVPPHLDALLMVGRKLSREIHKHKRDNLVDGAGYFQVVADIVEATESTDA